MKKLLLFMSILVSTGILFTGSCSDDPVADDPVEPETNDFIFIADTLGINVSEIVGPAIHRGSGFLFAFDTKMDIELIKPLKPQIYRTQIRLISKDVYDLCNSLDCEYQVCLRWGWNFQQGRPGDNGNWESWESHIRKVLDQLEDLGMKENLGISVWDNPDKKNDHFPTIEQFGEAWKILYDIVKEEAPHIQLAAPGQLNGHETWWWEEHRNDETWYTRQFLKYCKENDCFPDRVAIHEHSNDGSLIENIHYSLMDFYKEYDIEPIPLDMDDQGPDFRSPDQCFSPGVFVSLFAAIERVKINKTAKAVWHGKAIKDERFAHAGPDKLAGLITTDEYPVKRSLWWAYKYYADLVGDIVNVNKANTVDAVAALDKDNKTLRIIAGKFKESKDAVGFRINGLPVEAGEAKVTGYKIRWSHWDAAPDPNITFEKEIKIKNSKLSFDIDYMKKEDAYYFIIEL